MSVPVRALELEKQARYLQSIACLVKDAEKYDELQQKAGELLGKAKKSTPLKIFAE